MNIFYSALYNHAENNERKGIFEEDFHGQARTPPAGNSRWHGRIYPSNPCSIQLPITKFRLNTKKRGLTSTISPQ